MPDLPAPGAGIVVTVNESVTPEGRPLALRLIAELKPPEVVVVIATSYCPPLDTVIAAAEDDTVNAGTTAAVTFKVTIAVRTRLPPLAVTVIAYDPTDAFAATAIVMVDAPAPGAPSVTGLNVTVTPAG